MNDSPAVSRAECVRNLNPQLQHLLQRQRLAFDTVLEGQTIQKLHRNEELAILFAEFVDCANIWMIQGGSGLCFTVEAAQSL